MTDLSKEAQIARSPGGNQTCPTTGQPKRICNCWSCIGRRNRQKGKRKQRVARKVLEGVAGTAAPTSATAGNEESWRMRVRAEVKSGQQVKAMTTRFLAAEAQALAAKAVGDFRPFVFIAMPDGMSDGIVAFRLSAVDSIREALVP